MDTEKNAGGTRQIWFAAANSEHGFENHFPALFSAGTGADALYIVKGGPGTGKSGLMRRVARCAGEAGWQIVFLLCSSDPASLDGLLLTAPDGRTVGMLDGTAPHAWEPTLPGTRENLLDLGAFWDVRMLTAQRDAIVRLNLRKSAAYQRAYRCLRAAGEADRVAESLTAPCLREAKLDALAERLLRLAIRGGDWTRAVAGAVPPGVFRRAFAMTGRARLDTPERLAAKLLCISDRTGAGYRLLHLLRHKAAERGIAASAFCDPLRPDRADGILFRDSGLCILYTPGEPSRTDAATDVSAPERPRMLSLRPCLDTDSLRQIRPLLREAEHLREGALRAADRHLASAAEAHFALEKIYTAAMDFRAVTAFTDTVCARVLGRR